MKKYSVVSSENRIALQTFKQLGKSFVYMINNSGPNTDPCGTHGISFTNDAVLSYRTYYFLSKK